MIYTQNRFKRYEEESIFEKGKFREVSEEYFDNTVVRFRDQYKINYCGTYQEFTDINSGIRTRRYYN